MQVYIKVFPWYEFPPHFLGCSSCISAFPWSCDPEITLSPTASFHSTRGSLKVPFPYLPRLPLFYFHSCKPLAYRIRTSPIAIYPRLFDSLDSCAYKLQRRVSKPCNHLICTVFSHSRQTPCSRKLEAGELEWFDRGQVVLAYFTVS